MGATLAEAIVARDALRLRGLGIGHHARGDGVALRTLKKAG